MQKEREREEEKHQLLPNPQPNVSSSLQERAREILFENSVHPH